MATRKSPSKKSSKKSPKKSSKKPSKKSSAKKSGGLNAKLRPSASLAAITGPGAQSRGQVTKKIWLYIKKHKLQVESNKRMIKPDAKLAKVFGGKSAISMFTMTKKVSKHLS